MIRFSRRVALAAFSALALTACGQAETGEQADAPMVAGEALVTDLSLGSDDALIEVTEYASWTCTHCLDFHEQVMPLVKADYIDTGKVKFTFREFPTAPQNVAVAGFSLARCSGADNYYTAIDTLFAEQTNILNLARSGGDIEAALRDIASDLGIKGDAFEACLANEDVFNAIVNSVTIGDSQGINSTPSLVVDGVKVAGAEWRTAEGMKAFLDAKLADKGENATE